MKILIDINHPAHVHYFRNFIKIMQQQDHKFIVTNRDQKLINYLLDVYKIKHVTRNKRPDNNSIYSSLLYLCKILFAIYKTIRGEKVDMFVGFASFPCAFFSFFLRKSSVIIDDTEHNKINHILYKPFASSILTPFYFNKNMGEKQIYFNAYVEQLYLHSNYFENVINREKKYALIRFIAYDAHHDNVVNAKLSLYEKKKIIKEISKIMPIFLTMEADTEDAFFSEFLIKTKPEDIHELISGASIFITEGATMASEAGVLGVSYYYINPIKLGYINYQCDNYENAHQISMHKLLKNLETINYSSLNQLSIRKNIEEATIDPTRFMVWFVENYPESVKIMKDNPNYQNRFK